MSTTVLTDEQRILIEGECHARYAQGEKRLVRNAIELTEQAVLQSEQVKAWKKDAERYRSWRTATVNKNTAWLEAAIDYQAKHFANPEKPTADEFDAGIDAAMEKQK